MLTMGIGLFLLVSAIIIGIANVCLLILLLRSYWKTYQEIKSGFTIGLIYFSTFLLLQNILTTVFIAVHLIIPEDIVISEVHGARLPLFLINLVQLVALSILFKITRD